MLDGRTTDSTARGIGPENAARESAAIAQMAMLCCERGRRALALCVKTCVGSGLTGSCGDRAAYRRSPTDPDKQSHHRAYNNSSQALPQPAAIASGAVGKPQPIRRLRRAGRCRNDPELGLPPGGPSVDPNAPTCGTLPRPSGITTPLASPPMLRRARPQAYVDYNEIKDVGGPPGQPNRRQSDTALFWSPSAAALVANIRSLAGSLDLMTASNFDWHCCGEQFDRLLGLFVHVLASTAINQRYRRYPRPGGFGVDTLHLTQIPPNAPSAHSRWRGVLAFYGLVPAPMSSAGVPKGNGGSVRNYTRQGDREGGRRRTRVGRDALAPQYRSGNRRRRQCRQVHGKPSSQAARGLISRRTGTDRTAQSRRSRENAPTEHAVVELEWKRSPVSSRSLLRTIGSIDREAQMSHGSYHLLEAGSESPDLVSLRGTHQG